MNAANRSSNTPALKHSLWSQLLSEIKLHHYVQKTLVVVLIIHFMSSKAFEKNVDRLRKYYELEGNVLRDVFAINVKLNYHKGRDHPSSATSMFPLINQMWIQTIDSMVAGSKPNSRRQIYILLHFIFTMDDHMERF